MRTNTLQPMKPRLRKDEDGREMCFRQGKPCTYESETDENTIVTEWPNGVIEHMDVQTKTVRRTWPNGKTTTFAAGSPQDQQYPNLT